MKHLTVSFCFLLLNFFVGTLFANPFTVTIDAGHGGKDPGAIGSFAKEKDINLAVALKVGKLIQKNCPDVRVVYTRKTDIFIPLEERAMIANNAHSNLFICIHTNSSPSPSASGVETYTLGLAKTEANMNVARRENSVILLENNYKEKYQGFNPNSVDSYIMFEYMQDKYIARSVQFAADVEKECYTNADRSDRGVRQAGFWVLHQTAMPAVLIELGYISNPKEEEFLTSSEGQNRLAESIFQAFKEFKHEHERRSSTQLTSNSTSQTNSTNDEDTVQIAKTDTIKPTKESRKTRQTKKERIIATLPKQKKSFVSIDTTTRPVANEETPVFKVQFLLSDRKLPANSAKFKKLENVSFYQENNFYKYTAGDTNNFNTVIALHRKIEKLFPTAFIIAFVNDHKVPLQEAINLWKAQNKKTLTNTHSR
jgi:N-acetylmuramoyl-L-alanine amidase